MSRYIPENVERRLYAESMGRCMNPDCRKELFCLQGDIIERAHIDPYCQTADNSFENLVVLCPNCHSQTETYCSSSKGNHKKNYCLVCGKEISKKSTYCPECFHYLQRKVNRPSKDDLINDFNNLKSFLQVGRKYNVSDNAVRKWCKQYNYWPGHIKTLIRQ